MTRLTNLNQLLNKLKAIFDLIEPYQPDSDEKKSDINVGMRSLKNIGVWLTLYALTEEKQSVVGQLIDLSRIDSNQAGALRELLDELSTPQTLCDILNDYHKAGGTFQINVNTPERMNAMKQAMDEMHLKFLEPYLKLAKDSEANLEVQMENVIRFQWMHRNYLQPIEYEDRVKEKFNGNDEPIPYLQASYNARFQKKHAGVRYAKTKHDNKEFHIMEFATLVERANEHGRVAVAEQAYIIEPVDHKKTDLDYLQKHYFDILEAKPKPSEMTGSDYYDIVDIKFPQLAKPLKTIECRPGIYSVFDRKVIGSVFVPQVQYSGIRSLTYNKSGGEVRNSEKFLAVKCRSPIAKHTVTGPYLMVYAAGRGEEQDFYPFYIADPRKDLEKTFKDEKAATNAKVLDAKQSQLIWYAALLQRALRYCLASGRRYEGLSDNKYRVFASAAWDYLDCLKRVAAHYPQADLKYYETKMTKVFGQKPSAFAETKNESDYRQEYLAIRNKHFIGCAALLAENRDWAAKAANFLSNFLFVAATGVVIGLVVVAYCGWFRPCRPASEQAFTKTDLPEEKAPKMAVGS